MAELYKLREWLTVPDAAAHLSAAFDEQQVTEADVDRLGLDGHLTFVRQFRERSPWSDRQACAAGAD